MTYAVSAWCMGTSWDAQPDELKRLIVQWARWARQSMRYGRCGSAEGAWRSPQVWDAPDPRPAPISVAEALAVEHAITRPPLEPVMRVPLVWHHVHGAHPGYVCRLLRRRYGETLTVHDYDDALARAYVEVRSRLTRNRFLL